MEMPVNMTRDYNIYSLEHHEPRNTGYHLITGDADFSRWHFFFNVMVSSHLKLVTHIDTSRSVI